MELIRVDRPEPGVMVITLNRPQARNALSRGLLTELAEVLTDAETDDGIRAVVLTGDDRAFSAGADIKEMPQDGIPMFAEAGRLKAWKTIERFEKPLLAAVNGYALGGGCRACPPVRHRHLRGECAFWHPGDQDRRLSGRRRHPAVAARGGKGPGPCSWC